MIDLMMSVLLQATPIVAAPLLPGLIQALKARMQGRPGPTVIQPYRELRRLWRKSVFQPDGASFTYALAPAVVASCMLLALGVLPSVLGRGVHPWGTDALVLVGLLVLARCAITVSAWDTGSAFTLMGASRELMFGVFGEALLILSLLTPMIAARSTDLAVIVSGSSSLPDELARLMSALGFFTVVLLETGRQPIDNPDTHLELTMVHEGPLLEYAGMDVALLHWSASARHWIMLTLAVLLYVPLPAQDLPRIGAFIGALIAMCVALALIETLVAKMRILRVPALLGSSCVLALVAVVLTTVGSTR